MSHLSAQPGERAWTPDELAANPHLNAQKPEKVRRMFAAIARAYDLNNRLHSFGRDAAWRRAAVAAAAVRQGDEILDVACGTGELARAFAASLPRPARIVGLDFTPEMLDIARAKPPVRPSCATTPPLLEYVQGDATALPFADASFDVVSIAFGIRNVSDPAKALAEFRRVLRAGGRLVMLEFSQPGNPLLAALNGFYTRRVMPLTASLIARDRSGAYAYLPRSVASFASPEHLRGMVEGAGFREASSRPLTFGVCTVHRAVAGR